MTKSLRVLIIEDSENDAILLLRELRRSGYTPVHKRVDNTDDLLSALENEPWDIIISDFVMPKFSGLEALRLVREKGLDIPFIVTSGKISDETAVMTMKAGASDYIMKDNMSRLGPAIAREMQEAVVRQEREKASRELQAREEELRILKKMDELKDEFIGMVSHELRTPLTVVLGALSTIMTEGDKLSQREMKQLVSDAYWEAELLSDLLANLLELARVQANRLIIAEEPVVVKEAIKTVIDKFKQQGSLRDIEVDCSEAIIISADRVRLQRVLRNLLDNAIKYSDQGTKIEIFARKNEGEVLIGIRDQGIGISLENQGKLFEAFQRLQPENSVAVGTGLGLVVCKRLVEAHGGHIWVESQPGRGSTFYFTMPSQDESHHRTTTK